MYTINTLDAGGIGAVANLGGGVCPPVDVSRLIFDDDDAINDNIMIHVCVWLCARVCKQGKTQILVEIKSNIHHYYQISCGCVHKEREGDKFLVGTLILTQVPILSFR